MSLIQEKLPPAFQGIDDQLKGNPALGLLREQVILGMLIAFLGESKVSLPQSGVEADVDCYVDSQPLSIKTVSGSGRIRLKWTSNSAVVMSFIQTYRPLSDLLIIRIRWGNTGSMRYVPLSSQESVFKQIGERYLDYRGLTNTRGVNLSAEAERLVNDHRDTLTWSIRWQRSQDIVNPVTKWVEYWRH